MATTNKQTATTKTSKKRGDKPMTVNQAKKMIAALSMALTSRRALSSYLGKSYGGDRDLYTALGYTKTPTFEQDYMARYERQDIARAIVDAPVRACWRDLPEITEAEDKPTEFEKQLGELMDRRSVYHYLSRCDRLSSIGEYAVMLLGFDDGNELGQEVTSAKDLLYLMPYSQSVATIDKYDEDTKSERYGQVSQYSINMSVGTSVSSISKLVHWSRVIHVSQDNLSSDVFGIPVLQSILNRLQDIELISGGSAEMFWRGAFPGLTFKVDEGARVIGQDETELEDEIEKYIHGLKRYLALQGISVEAIAQQVADPSPNINILIDLICAATRIPKRVLMGSERGELASSQDEKMWAKRVDERRREHCEAMILRPVIDRLVKVGVLPEPKVGYSVNWPDMLTASDKEKAEVGAIKAKALKDYVDSIGAADILPPDIFLRQIMQFTDEQIEQINAMVEQQQTEADGDGDLLMANLRIKYPDHVDSVTRRKVQELLDSDGGNVADLIAEFVSACGRADVERHERIEKKG